MPGLFPLGIDPTDGAIPISPVIAPPVIYSPGGYFPVGYFPIGSSAGTSSRQLRTPHVVTVYPMVANRTGNVRTVPTDAAGVAVACQVGAETASAAFERTGRELSNPHYLLCNVADGANFDVGSRVIGTLKKIPFVWTVAAKPQYHLADNLGVTDYVFVLLEQREYTA